MAGHSMIFRPEQNYSKQNNLLASQYITGYLFPESYREPNHIHALITFPNTGKIVNQIIGNGKRFMAYDIVSKLKEKGNENISDQLEASVKPPDRKRGKLQEVFETSFDIKEWFSFEFI